MSTEQSKIASFDTIFTQTLNHLKADWQRLGFLAAIVTAFSMIPLVPLFIIQMPGQNMSFGQWVMSNPSGGQLTESEVQTIWDSFMGYLNQPSHLAMVGIGAILAIIIGIVATTVLTIASQRVIDDASLNMKQAFRQGLRDFWKYWWVGLLSGIVILGGFVFFIIPGLIFLVWFNFAKWDVLLEDKKGRSALVSSRRLVQGRWWAVAGRIILFAFIVGLVSSMSGLVISVVSLALPAAALVINSFVSAIVALAKLVFDYHLYLELKGQVVKATTEGTD